MPAPEHLIPGHSYGLWGVQEHLNRYRFASRYVAGKEVVDVACGYGDGSFILLKAGARLVCGTDKSSKALKYATAHYASPKLRFIEHDVRTPFPFKDKSVAVVVCFEILEHIANQWEFLLECNRILKKDGLIVCSSPNKSKSSPTSLESPNNPYHVRELFPDEFIEIFSSVFNGVRLHGQTVHRHVRTINRYARLDSRMPTIREFMPRRVNRSGVREADYVILVGTKNPNVDSQEVSRVFEEWKVRRAEQIIKNLRSAGQTWRAGDPLSKLLKIYWMRRDLQHRFPEVQKGEYSRLLEWCKYTVGLASGDTGYRTLAKYRDWFAQTPWEKQVAELTSENSALRTNLSTVEKQVAELTLQLQTVSRSVAYRIMRYFAAHFDRIFPYGTSRGEFRKILVKSAQIAADEGVRSLLVHVRRKISRREFRIVELGTSYVRDRNVRDAYEDLLARDGLTVEREKEILDDISQFKTKPRISVLTPIYNTDRNWLESMIRSVLNQLYQNWELCICDDGSRQEVWEVLEAYAMNESRIRLVRLSENSGVAKASNEAFRLATGEYIALLDHDDVIAKDALFQVVKAINDEPDVDFLYSDEDKIAEGGARCNPFFKPDWSPELLRCIPYVSHLAVIRKPLLDSIGGFDERFRYSPDYYLQLRATDKARRVVHIPRVLYSWRMTRTSVSASTSGQKSELLCRENLNELREFAAQKRLGVAKAWPYPNTFRMSYDVKGKPLVTIIIPTYDRVDLLRKCLRSIERCSYSNKEILLITNNRDETSNMWAYLRTLPHRVMRYEGEFSWSGMNNRAAEIASGEYLIFLNDDTEVITTNWIERLLEYAQQPDVGAVGCRLLFPSGGCQHAGVTSDPVYVAYHQFKEVIGDGYHCMIMLAREVSAVTGACMMVRREVFQKLHGFESALKYVYNDIDYCWRLGEFGYRIIYAASVELRHREGASRYGRVDKAAAAHDTLYMLRKWRGKLLSGDPFHNHNLTNARIDSFGMARFFYPARQVRKNGTSVLLVSHNLNLEGSTLGIFNIGKSLRSSGYLVAVVSPCDGKLRDAYLKNGIPVLIMPDFGHLASIGNEDLMTFMASFDVIFANTILMYFVVPFVRAFRFRANPRIVWMIRESPNLDEFCREVGTTTQMLKYAFANADRVVFLCKATRDLFTQFDKVGNFAVIHDSVDWDDYTDLSRKSSFHFDGNAFNVLSVGTIYQGKGQDVLVNAALDLLTKTDCNFKFHFVGKIGHEEFYQTLRKKIDRHGMGGRIVFLGELSRRDVVRAYSECSAFVLPSRRESFPTVVLEAMAAGKPIIATKVFGTVEQVVDNHSALLVEPNDKSSLADALLRIYSDSALAMRLGDNARKEFLERFTLKTMAGKFQELVEELTPEPLSSLARMH